MTAKATGKRIKCSVNSEEPYWAFVPDRLPPASLNIENLHKALDKANQALGRLDGMSSLLPEPEIFLYMYVRLEAVLSSQIEGTQSSLSDLLLYESEQSPGTPLHDVEEVSNYVRAMNYGLEKLENGKPFSMRLIREMHEILMEGMRGGTKSPGSFRRTQNWVGGSHPGNASFVPPPPDMVTECMSDLEKFLHEEKSNMPLLVKAALIHHQFETIHPFLDGNGRLGRLLITLILCSHGVLSQPILYLSLYFKTYRNDYYAHLQKVRDTGDWEPWLDFFLAGVHKSATQATKTASDILRLMNTDRDKIKTLGRSTGTVLQIHHFLEKKPFATIPLLVKSLGLSTPTVTAGLHHLEELGIVRETTGKPRDRVYVYAEYLKKLLESATFNS